MPSPSYKLNNFKDVETRQKRCLLLVTEYCFAGGARAVCDIAVHCLSSVAGYHRALQICTHTLLVTPQWTLLRCTGNRTLLPQRRHHHSSHNDGHNVAGHCSATQERHSMSPPLTHRCCHSSHASPPTTRFFLCHKHCASASRTLPVPHGLGRTYTQQNHPFFSNHP
jgi:hypothetical protein